MANDGELVIPGAILSTVEEYTPAVGTYEEDGNVYASLLGEVKFDTRNRAVSVVPKAAPIPSLKRGDQVYGRIFDLKEQVALVEISCNAEDLDREVTDRGMAGIHISRVSDRYVKEIKNEFRPGDIVVAKVTEVEPQLSLDTRDAKYGVLKAYCSVCGEELIRKGRDLECGNCGNKETRKMSEDYGIGLG